MTAPKKVDTAKLKAEILDGRHDRDLTALLQAVRARVDAEASLGYRWKISLDGHEWTEDEVTFAEVQIAEKIIGASWLTHSVSTSAVHLAAYMFAHLARTELGEDGARARIDALTLEEVAGAVTQYVKVDVPKAGPETSTKP